MPQVGGRLPLARWRQVAVRADRIGLGADRDGAVALRTYELGPLRIAFATVAARHRPWTGQGIVDRGDLVVQEIRVGAVEADALLDDGLIVAVQRNPAAVEGAGTFHAAGLDRERVVAAVPLGVLPRAGRKAGMRRLDRGRPLAAVG